MARVQQYSIRLTEELMEAKTKKDRARLRDRDKERDKGGAEKDTNRDSKDTSKDKEGKGSSKGKEKGKEGKEAGNGKEAGGKVFGDKGKEGADTEGSHGGGKEVMLHSVWPWEEPHVPVYGRRRHHAADIPQMHRCGDVGAGVEQ